MLAGCWRRKFASKYSYHKGKLWADAADNVIWRYILQYSIPASTLQIAPKKRPKKFPIFFMQQTFIENYQFMYLKQVEKVIKLYTLLSAILIERNWTY